MSKILTLSLNKIPHNLFFHFAPIFIQYWRDLHANILQLSTQIQVSEFDQGAVIIICRNRNAYTLYRYRVACFY